MDHESSSLQDEATKWLYYSAGTTHPSTASVGNQKLELFLLMFCDLPTPIVPTINKVCAVSPHPILLILCIVTPLILGPSCIINLAQLVSSSVALPAELIS